MYAVKCPHFTRANDQTFIIYVFLMDGALIIFDEGGINHSQIFLLLFEALLQSLLSITFC